MARAGITVDRLTRAAAELADREGLEAVTLSALARGFGVRDASLYAHVRSLRELRVRVALLGADEMTDRIGVAVAGRAGRDALVAFADAYRAYALDHPGRYAATQLRLEPEEAEELADAPGFRRSVELTYGMLRGYGLAEPDLTDAGRLLRSTFHGYVDLELRGAFGHPRAVADSWARSLGALHLLLENWPRAPSGEPAHRPPHERKNP
ncbi:TetR/AcrR family transcriptional regulator [Streptomyces sp. LP05-1]|uniref:TetR/AcrR family transcriptional regulator n=1 Tax=Streptomyces pyxinae TaxID=2970734 RepID=A0ABT2CIS0_9ACTN|nr:TetR/AcrR family transcriptional regulator [Streptomyces sp. LP05-1]MCS0637185.1 TetR/AcrR family transcriptional regulator [Streptomyces sp. LP05-1]